MMELLDYGLTWLIAPIVICYVFLGLAKLLDRLTVWLWDREVSNN